MTLLIVRRFIAICLFIAIFTGIKEPEVIAAERPNFVLCMTDDQGWGDVGYYGHKTLQTPVLDEMAATGLRFDRFYAAHPVCSPTRGSFLTGRHPNRFACFSWGHTLRPEEVTIAEALKTAGYSTGHFGKWHLGSCKAEDEVSPGHSGFDTWVSSPNFYENSPLLSQNGTVIKTEGESSAVTVHYALDFIKQQTKNKQPFLAVIWFGNPHTPHVGVEELKDLYPNATKAEQNYYAEITGIDRAMGTLRSELRSMGVANNTVLLFTSDNGPQGKSPGVAERRDGEHNVTLKGAKGSLWEGGVRVPGIVEWPAVINQHRVTDYPASTSDIYPTVLELAGVTMEHQPPLDGQSLVPVLRGDDSSPRKPMGFWEYPIYGIGTPAAKLLAAQLDEQHGKVDPTPPPKRTDASLMQKQFDRNSHLGHAVWLDGNWKLHRVPHGKNSVAYDYELYNLATDPGETMNVAAEHEERVSTMRAALTQWQQSVLDSLNGVDYRAE